MATATGAAALRATVTGKPSDVAAAAAAAGQDLKPKDLVKSLLEQNKLVIQQALPKHMNPERLMRVAITSVTSNPKLLECYVPTLIGGIIQCSQMGLEPNTVLGHAYLVPFWNTKKSRTDAQVIIGYKGLIDLARRSGQITSIAAHAVFENDLFEFEYGLCEKLRHVPADENRGEIRCFYAVAHMKDGGHAFEVMSAASVKDIRDKAAIKNRAKRNSDGSPIISGPWKDHFEEMGRKTVIRRLSKYLPLSVEMATAVAMEDTTARGDTQNLEGVLEGDYTVAPDDDGSGFDGDDGDNTSSTVDKGTGEIKTGAGQNAGAGDGKASPWDDWQAKLAQAKDAADLDFLRSTAKELTDTDNQLAAVEMLSRRAGEIAAGSTK